MKIKTILTLLALVAISISGFSQDNNSNSQFVNPSDFVFEITLNNNYFLECKTDSLNIIGIRQVYQIKDSLNTISLSFNYGSWGTVLKVHNPFKRLLNYRAEMYNFKHKKYVETSIVPVFGGIFSMEMWGHPIDKMRLFEFKLIDEPEPMPDKKELRKQRRNKKKK